MQRADDPIPTRFRTALDEIYGNRVERVVLFGSRARRCGPPDSDYDVAVFLRGMADRWDEVRRIVPVVTDILYEDLRAHRQGCQDARRRAHCVCPAEYVELSVLLSGINVKAPKLFGCGGLGFDLSTRTNRSRASPSLNCRSRALPGRSKARFPATPRRA